MEKGNPRATDTVNFFVCFNGSSKQLSLQVLYSQAHIHHCEFQQSSFLSAQWNSAINQLDFY